MIKNYINPSILIYLFNHKLLAKCVNISELHQIIKSKIYSFDIIEKWMIQAFPGCESVFEVENQHFLDQIQGFPCGFGLIAWVDKFLEVRWFFFLNISFLKSDKQVKTNVFFFVSFLFGEFVFLNVLDDLSGSN